MVKTKWGQGAPFNQLCPTLDGKATYSGCVATAQAQFMKFYNYPPSGKGTHSYVWEGQQLSIDLSAKPFDWQSMLDAYGETATDKQKEAVAYLMQACGYTVDMAYGTSDSGASVWEQAPSLIRYFGYAPSSTPIYRKYFTLADWQNRIYASLEKGYPVLYSGFGGIGGHAFICDGYSSDGFYHFNWGWSGSSDGYYKLSALNPPHIGIGGGDGGFNARQIAIVNARPDFEGSKFTPILGLDGLPSFTYSNVSGRISFSGTIYNYSNCEFDFRIGYEFIDASGKKTYGGGTSAIRSIPVAYSLSSYTAAPDAKLADGVYKFRPAFAVDNGDGGLEWHNVSIAPNAQQYFTLTIKDGKGEIQAPEEYGNTLTATDFTIPAEIRHGMPFDISAKLTNTSEIESFEDIVIIITTKDGRKVYNSKPFPVNIPGNSSEMFEANISINSIGGGEYKAFLVTRVNTTMTEWTEISPKLDIKLLPPPEKVTLASEGFTIDQEKTDEGLLLNITMDVKCTDGYYGKPIYLWVDKGNSDWSDNFQTEDVILEKGETKQVKVSYLFSGAVMGKEYSVLVNYRDVNDKNAFFAREKFIAGQSGIDDIYGQGRSATLVRDGNGIVVSAPADIVSLHVYDTTGVESAVKADIASGQARIALDGLKSGMYIIRVETTAKAETFKFVK